MFLMTVLFSIPIIVLCIYAVALTELSFKHATLVDCFFIVMLQIFMVCWYGNEVTINVSTVSG